MLCVVAVVVFKLFLLLCIALRAWCMAPFLIGLCADAYRLTTKKAIPQDSCTVIGLTEYTRFYKTRKTSDTPQPLFETRQTGGYILRRYIDETNQINSAKPPKHRPDIPPHWLFFIR